MPPERFKEGWLLDHMDRVLRLAINNADFTGHLLGGSGMDGAWLELGARIGHLRRSCDPLGRAL